MRKSTREPPENLDGMTVPDKHGSTPDLMVIEACAHDAGDRSGV